MGKTNVYDKIMIKTPKERIEVLCKSKKFLH